MSEVICLSSDEEADALSVAKKPRLVLEPQKLEVDSQPKLQVNQQLKLGVSEQSTLQVNPQPKLQVKESNLEQEKTQANKEQSSDICLISSSDEDEEEVAGNKIDAATKVEEESHDNLETKTEEARSDPEKSSNVGGKETVIDLESSEDEASEETQSEKKTVENQDVADFSSSAVGEKVVSNEKDEGEGGSEQNDADREVDLGSASDSKEEPAVSEDDLFTQFISLCLKIVNNNKKPEHIRIITAKAEVIKKMHTKVGPEFCNSPSFKDLLRTNLNRIRTEMSDSDVVICFVQIYDELKHRYQDRCASRTNDKRLANLEKVMHKLHRHIKRLEDAEVDFDDEENSHYLQLETYKRKLVSVYSFYCRLKKQDVDTTLTMFPRLDFASSQYTEVNKAINHKYNNNRTFPTFYDFDRYIRRKVEGKLDIAPQQLHAEIKSCFEKYGSLLQKRRKIELLTAHNTFVTSVVDPASEDPELDTKLRANKKECDEKTKSICEKFVKMQESRMANAETDQYSSSGASSDSD